MMNMPPATTYRSDFDWPSLRGRSRADELEDLYETALQMTRARDTEGREYAERQFWALASRGYHL